MTPALAALHTAHQEGPSESRVRTVVNPKCSQDSRSGEPKEQTKEQTTLSLFCHYYAVYIYIHTYMHTYIYICMYVCVCMSYVYFAQLIGLYLTLLHAPVIERTSSEKRHICVSSGIPVLSKVGFVNLPSDGHV